MIQFFFSREFLVTTSAGVGMKGFSRSIGHHLGIFLVDFVREDGAEEFW
jgi:hypothetical protein